MVPTLYVDNWEGREIEKDGKCGHDFATVINEKESQSKERKGVSFVGCE